MLIQSREAIIAARGSDRSARNALQSPSGARSAVACRALYLRHPGPPCGPPDERSGRERPFVGSHPGAGGPADPSPTPPSRPRLPSSASPIPAGPRAPGTSLAAPPSRTGSL